MKQQAKAVFLNARFLKALYYMGINHHHYVHSKVLDLSVESSPGGINQGANWKGVTNGEENSHSSLH